jgi:hypothetical protein
LLHRLVTGATAALPNPSKVQARNWIDHFPIPETLAHFYFLLFDWLGILDSLLARAHSSFPQIQTLNYSFETFAVACLGREAQLLTPV